MMAFPGQQFLSGYFLQPEGFLAALALIPLIIFYLVKKKPDEEVMPSIMFFMKNRKSGKARTALRTFLRNFLLLFHILLVLGMAAAIADPFLDAPANSDRAVIVMDRSASITDEVEDVKSFAKSNLGPENTLLTVAETTDIPLENAHRSQTSSKIDQLEATETETDISNALQVASRYSGPIIIASDLDQTVNSRDASEIVEQLRDSGRTVKTYEAKTSNSWGIVSVGSQEGQASIDVKNFANSTRKLPVEHGETIKDVTVESNAVATVKFDLNEGKNRFSLPSDDLEADNEAYFFYPEQNDYKVTLISEEENPYMRKAFDLIDFTEFEKLTPPVEQELDSDIYIIGESDNLLSETVSEIESQTKSGKAMIAFAETGIETGMDSVPVEKTGEARDMNVEIRKPRRIDIGTTNVIEVNRTRGESLTASSNALVQAEYGEGEVLFYNIDDSDFNKDFLYPVFWKQITRRLVDEPSVNQLNVETGEQLQIQGETKTLYDTGFYNSSGRTYAANLESEDESSEEQIQTKTGSNVEEGTEQKNIQNLVAVLLGLLVTAEMAYLYRIGELKW
ncbi:MAG: VWA domain-containing protein [Nanohaloarchaea archaeon]|nr:VWA domain-containing protein [Candidatus Nanohaloarchaea archaeon]